MKLVKKKHRTKDYLSFIFMIEIELFIINEKIYKDNW